MKKFICFLLCLSCLLCTTACKDKGDNSTETENSTVSTATSSNVSSAPTVPSTPESSVPDTSDTSSDTTTFDTTSDATTSDTTTSDTTTSDSENQKEILEMLYGFSSIEKVESFCVKNIPDSDLVYAVSTVLTNSGEMNNLDLTITCPDSSITTNYGVITIPRAYAKKHSSAKFTATHEVTGLSCDFTINFGKEWALLFEDQFEGTELDKTVWEHRPEWLRDKGYVNYWSKELTFLDGKGNLISRATPGKKTVNGQEVDAYLSGAVSTRGLFESTHGYYEAKVKLHHQTGMWGAFWLVCGDMNSSNPASDNSSVNGCEIDVFESLYNYDGVCQNLHWDGFTGHTQSAPSNGYVTYIDTYDNEYHTFAVSWTPNEYVFLVDGVVTRRINAEEGHGICEEPGYMLITTECGTWAGEWVLDEGEYSDMLVDYVRVYSYPEN